MIKEVLVVEGKMDVVAIDKAVEADCIITGGFSLKKSTMNSIEQAYRKRGIIIMTDPDSAGERIRKFLTKRFPEARHAFVPKEDATANDDIGIEQASPEAIRTALEKVRTLDWNPSNEFSGADLITARVSGTAAAAARRHPVAKRPAGHPAIPPRHAAMHPCARPAAPVRRGRRLRAWRRRTTAPHAAVAARRG